jgi:hypothetical protein
MGILNRTSLAAVLAWGLASFAFAGPTWYQSLGLTKDQKIQFRKCNRVKSAAIKQAYSDKEGNSEYLARQVLSNSGDEALQPTLGQVLASLQTMEGADDDYWRNLQSFLAPSQVAKIYLKFHPDVPPAAAPSRPKDKVNWVSYIGLTPAQIKQLKSANIQWMVQMKEKVSERTSAYLQLEKAVQTGAPDAQIQPILNALLATVREKHRIEQDYYGKDLPAFLGPTQVAKLYLRRRPPKTGFNPPSNTPVVKYPVARKSGPGM